MAGFKHRKFSITYGSTEFPTGTTAQNIRTKEECIVKKVADALIDMGIGWACDTARNATTSDFVDVPKYSSTTAAPGLFLVNTISGCKLFISYLSGTYSGGLCFYDTDGTTKIFDDSQVCTISHYSYPGSTNVQGFIASMIPEGSANSFGLTFSTSFLPSDATRIIGTATSSTYVNSSRSSKNLVISGSSGNVYNFRVLATPYCIGICYGTPTSLITIPRFFCGRILGDLTNPDTDTLPQAKYGAFSFVHSPSSSTAIYDYISDISYTNNYATYSISNLIANSSNSISVIGISMADTRFQIGAPSSYPEPFVGNCISIQDGTWVCNTAGHGVAAQVNVYPIGCIKAYDNTSNTRPWQPIAMIVDAIDSNSEWTGIKGYLDTSLFRASPQFAAGTLLDNGNFVCTGQGSVTLGWDPSNPSW